MTALSKFPVAPSTIPRALYSGTDRLGSFKQTERGEFDAYDRRGRLLGTFPTQSQACDAILHIGDHDPSGVSMFLAFLEDVEAFTRELGGEAAFTRLAVTPQQIAAYGLPTAPAKETHRRAFAGQTCQAEALAPDVLARILRTAIEERINRRAFERVLAKERKVRRELIARLSEGER